MISKLVVTKHLSFELLESEGFVAFVIYLNPKAPMHMPKADYLITHIMTKYFEAKAKLTNVLHNVKKISITCDLWTSPNSMSTLGVTGH